MKNPYNRAKIIAVYGNGGSGKSMVAYYLAYLLTKGKQNVVAVSVDTLAPCLPIWAPLNRPTHDVSIAPLLLKGGFNTPDILERIVMHPKNGFMGFMGFQNGVTPMTHGTFGVDYIVSYFTMLTHEVDYVIVDCLSNPVGDSFTLTAMEYADIRIRVITPDAKGIVYETATEPLLQDGRFQYEQHLVMVNQVHEYAPIKELRLTLGEWNYTLPYCVEVKEKITAAQLPIKLKHKNSLLLEQEITRCANDIRKWKI